MREESPPVESRSFLGRLELVSRKSGAVASTFVLDAERITIGRDYDCDVRLYLPDVSKLHAELQFDLDSGVAALTVHGNNGVIHTPAGGKSSIHKPGSVVVLADADTFLIRKKLFRFSYGEQRSQLAYMSPVSHRTSTTSVAPSTPRRRASHRLSLVPQGRRFQPSPAKLVGLGLQDAVTPRKLCYSTEQPIGEGSATADLVNVAEGDDGDKLYLERKDDEGDAVNDNLGTPSALDKSSTTNGVACHSPAIQHSEGSCSNHSVALKTPRSVPLPHNLVEAASCPAGPVGELRPDPIVSARIAYSTPRGSDSLRKALLVRSARKVWEESRVQGLDGEIQTGNIEVRRKSWSPKPLSRKSTAPTPRPGSESSSEGDEASDDDREEAFAESGALQWVYEDGQVEVSQFDDSDSDRESMDNDMSIPGLSVLDFHSHAAGDDLSENDGDEEEDGQSVEHSSEDGSLVAVSDQDQHEDSSSSDSQHSDRSDASSCDGVDDDVPLSAPQSDAHVPALMLDRFFTPQPSRKSSGGPRLSLAGIMGPAVRFTPIASSPSPQIAGKLCEPVGTLGRPSRPPRTPEAMRFSTVESPRERPFSKQESPTEPAPKVLPPWETISTPSRASGFPNTPAKTPSRRMEETRGALATPRPLAAPPKGGFGHSAREDSEASALTTTTTPHRVFSSTSPLDDVATPGVSRTPMDDIKRRLGALRLKSASKSAQRHAKVDHIPARRATVGFALPDTPSRASTNIAELSFSVGRRGHQTPSAWSVEPIAEGDSESMLSTPSSDSGALLDADSSSTGVTSESAEGRTTPHPPRRRASLKTPVYTGLRNLLKEPRDLVTPRLDGVRQLLATPKAQNTPDLHGVRDLLRTPKPAQTPMLAGLREMMKEPAAEEASPSLAGLREVFREPGQQPATPALTGVRELFAPVACSETPRFDGSAEMYEDNLALAEQGEIEVTQAVEEEKSRSKVTSTASIHLDNAEVGSPITALATGDQDRQPACSSLLPSALSQPGIRTRSKLPTRSTAAVKSPTTDSTFRSTRSRVSKSTATDSGVPPADVSAVSRSSPAASGCKVEQPVRRARRQAKADEPSVSEPVRTTRVTRARSAGRTGEVPGVGATAGKDMSTETRSAPANVNRRVTSSERVCAPNAEANGKAVRPRSRRVLVESLPAEAAPVNPVKSVRSKGDAPCGRRGGVSEASEDKCAGADKENSADEERAPSVRTRRAAVAAAAKTDRVGVRTRTTRSKK